MKKNSTPVVGNVVPRCKNGRPFTEEVVRVLDERHIKRSALATACGISNASVTRVLSGSRPLSVEVARKIASFLSIECEDDSFSPTEVKRYVSPIICKNGKTFGQNAEMAMMKKGLKLADVAGALDISPKFLILYLNDQMRPSEEKQIAISDYLGFELKEEWTYLEGFSDKVRALIDEKHIDVDKMCKDLDVRRSFFEAYMRGTRKPKVERRKEIFEYLMDAEANEVEDTQDDTSKPAEQAVAQEQTQAKDETHEDVSKPEHAEESEAAGKPKQEQAAETKAEKPDTDTAIAVKQKESPDNEYFLLSYLGAMNIKRESLPSEQVFKLITNKYIGKWFNLDIPPSFVQEVWNSVKGSKKSSWMELDKQVVARWTPLSNSEKGSYRRLSGWKPAVGADYTASDDTPTTKREKTEPKQSKDKPAKAKKPSAKVEKKEASAEKKVSESGADTPAPEQKSAPMAEEQTEPVVVETPIDVTERNVSETVANIEKPEQEAQMDISAPCEMCQNKWQKSDWGDGDSHEFRIDGDALYSFDSQFGWEGIKVKFCPMCGRKLTTPPDGYTPDMEQNAQKASHTETKPLPTETDERVASVLRASYNAGVQEAIRILPLGAAEELLRAAIDMIKHTTSTTRLLNSRA